VGRTDIDDALARLDQLTQEEVWMAAVQGLKAAHAVHDEVQSVNDKGQQVADDIGNQKRSSSLTGHEGLIALTGDQLHEHLRNWLSPPDPSVNYHTASHARHEGTNLWFMGCGAFKNWKVSNSLLWIYGKRTFPLPSSSLWLMDLFFFSRFGEECPQVCHTSKSFGRDC